MNFSKVIVGSALINLAIANPIVGAKTIIDAHVDKFYSDMA